MKKAHPIVARGSILLFSQLRQPGRRQHQPHFVLELPLLRRIIGKLFVMDAGNTTLPVGQQVSLPGHLDLPVTLESAHPFGKGFKCPTPIQMARTAA
jgi:hypothetical protein